MRNPKPPSPETFDAILKDLENGGKLKETVELYWNWHDWHEYLSINPDAANRYSLAQAARAEHFVEESVEIADTELDPQRARIRIETRRWYATKMNAKKYGERLDINVTQQPSIKGALADARRRALPLSDLSNVVDAELVETKQIAHESPSDSESLTETIDDILK